MKGKILIYLFMFFLLVSFIYAYNQTDNLTHVYQFNQTAGNLIDYIWTLNSSSDDTPGKTNTGIYGNAWDFESNYVSFGANSMPSGTTPRCISCWIKIESTGGNPKYQVMWGYGTNTGAGTRWRQRVPFDGVNVLDYGGGGTIDCDYDTATGVWEMTTLSLDTSGKLTLWRNATLIKNVTPTAAIVTSAGDMWLGDTGATADEPFDGLMDECVSYNRSCGQSDITLLFTSFFPYGASAPVTDDDPPNISNAICTSCNAGTHFTTDQTPTINVTLNKAGLSCISNQSDGDYTVCTDRGGKCNDGDGLVDVCTLPANQSLTQTNKNQTLYFWANNSYGYYHTLFNLSTNVSLLGEVSFSNNQTNATSLTPKFNDTLQINLTISTGSGLSQYVLAHNQTGSWVNQTFRNLSGTSYTIIENITITLKRNGVLDWKIWANSTANTINESNAYIVDIKNSAPKVPTLIHPTNNSQLYIINGTVDLNYTTLDVDGDTVTYYVYSGSASGFCYQETANASSVCGLSTGKYFVMNYSVQSGLPSTNFYDGNWSTQIWSGANPNYSIDYAYVNYTKPTGSQQNQSLWQVKSSSGTKNLSIPTECWNFNVNTLVLRGATGGNIPEYYDDEWDCFDGTNWVNLSYYSLNTGLYEEAMWWYIAQLIFNGTTNFSWSNRIRNNYTWFVKADDGSANSSDSNIYNFEVMNSFPNTPIVYSPVNNKNYTSVTISYSSYDFDGDSITFKVYINGSLNYSGSSNISNWAAGDGSYELKVTAYDGYNNSANSSAIIFRKDNTYPYFVNASTNATDNILNGSFVYFNITIVDNAWLDAYIFSCNCSGTWSNRTTDISSNHYKAMENLTITVLGTIGYRWYANDTSGNMNMSELYTFTTAPYTIWLNGLRENRSYEYQTTANITTNLPYIDILDDTNRYANQTSPFNYSINILRINKFNNTFTIINISSGSYNTKIVIDNRTDLYNLTLNLTSWNSSSNVTINYTGYVYLPGKLLSKNLQQDSFLFGGVYYNTLNMTFTTADSKTIYINFSRQGDLNRVGYLNITLKAYDLDNGNSFVHYENFSNSTNFVNASSLFNTSAPMSVYDDFENNATKVNYDDSGSSDTSCDYYTYDYGDGRDKLYRISTSSSGSTICIVNVNQLILNNISVVNFTAVLENSYTCGFACSCTGYNNLYLTDGTNEVLVYTDGGPSCNAPGPSSYTVNKLFEIHKSGNYWDVYLNKTYQNTKDISSLNGNYYLKFKSYFSGSGGTSGSSGWNLADLKTSGIRLKRMNGTYETNVTYGNFESKDFTTTTNNIARAYLEYSANIPSGTSIKPYVSNDNGTTYESIANYNFHTFTSTGKSPKLRFVLNSTVNTSSPIIYNYVFKIIPASISSMWVDIGVDGIYEYIYNYTLNTSTTPVHLINESSVRDYMVNCSYDKCLIPIKFFTSSGGILEISKPNLTRDINPIILNTSLIQNLNEIPIKLSYPDGLVYSNDLKTDFRGSRNITVYAHSANYTDSMNYTIFAKYSSFNLSYFSKFNYWQIFPSKKNQSNIQPYGQNTSNGIWKITSLAYDGNSDIYAKYNESNVSCITGMEFRGQNFTRVPNNMSVNSLNITNLTISNKKLLEHLNDSNYGNIFTYTQINCSGYSVAYLSPTFCFNSLCSDCVKTQDWESNCELEE